MFLPKTVMEILLAPKEEPRDILESGFLHHTLLTPCPIVPAVLPSSLPENMDREEFCRCFLMLLHRHLIFQVCRMI